MEKEELCYTGFGKCSRCGGITSPIVTKNKYSEPLLYCTHCRNAEACHITMNAYMYTSTEVKKYSYSTWEATIKHWLKEES